MDIKQMKNIIACLFVGLLCASPISSAEEVYKVSADDALTIIVFGEKDLSFSGIKIGTDGNLSFPLVGNIPVAGLTTGQIEEKIESLLKEGYLKNPQATVSIKEYRSIYIYGEVRRPGAYPYQKGLTIEKAIVLAGGLTARASNEKVTVVHEEEPEKIIQTKRNARLRPGDIVTIKESFF
ncbi:MAG: polysaccharide export protein [Gammaproteobacteria bacterium]|nr:MAG: polysaccharide export protein [Gammaproteobacteria bacterium]